MIIGKTEYLVKTLQRLEYLIQFSSEKQNTLAIFLSKVIVTCHDINRDTNIELNGFLETESWGGATPAPNTRGLKKKN
jgi:hypothetical protein